MSKYNVVMEMKNATVVSEYEPEKKRSDAYQSEAALEKEFIRMLTEQGYEYAKDITDSVKMIHNFLLAFCDCSCVVACLWSYITPAATILQ